ncbi:MAG TPA: DNA polymerase/3'-5' exonuclease PolX [Thermoanaerobaculia bacterium]|nr:DNA polymerase/3'-5' exonuclease PolX [Thermoanaerobaculia bacterium]
MDNAEIARHLTELADLLEIQDANPFRVRAYRNAVRTIETQTTHLARFADEGRELTDLPGIGKEMASHIVELCATGKLAVLEEMLQHVPASLIELMRLPGVGPKKAKRLWDELGVETVDALEAAAEEGRIAALAGFGARSQEKILAGIAEYRQHRSRFALWEADRAVEPLVGYLRACPEVERLEVAGSYRRRRETVGDIDLLAIATEPEPVMARFLGYPQVARVEMSGPTRASVGLGSGLQVDLRVVPPESYGAALVYFTGSKEHNIRLRQRGLDRGLRVSEYGVFREEDRAARPEKAHERDPLAGERVAGAEEAEVYDSLGLAWIPPELREDRGEVEAAAAGALPRLLELGDLRGDLQMHSTWSDGKDSIEGMLEACAARGYEYFALTDHSKSLAMTGGLDARRLREQWREIDQVQARHPEIRLLKSQEVDILADGTLDTDDETLAGLDLVLISIHSRFELPEAAQTERLLKAVAHPLVNVLAHPTGRIIGRRKPYAFDVERVLRACAEHNVAVELNSHPERLDLKDTHLIRARELGIPVVVSTDSHRARELELIRYGVEQARRAWLEPVHVLNTRPVDELLAALEK